MSAGTVPVKISAKRSMMAPNLDWLSMPIFDGMHLQHHDLRRIGKVARGGSARVTVCPGTSVKVSPTPTYQKYLIAVCMSLHHPWNSNGDYDYAQVLHMQLFSCSCADHWHIP